MYIFLVHEFGGMHYIFWSINWTVMQYKFLVNELGTMQYLFWSISWRMQYMYMFLILKLGLHSNNSGFYEFIYMKWWMMMKSEHRIFRKQFTWKYVFLSYMYLVICEQEVPVYCWSMKNGVLCRTFRNLSTFYRLVFI